MEKPIPIKIKHSKKWLIFSKRKKKFSKKNSQDLNVKAAIEQIQKKIRDNCVPLGNMWHYLKELKAAKDDTIDVDIEHLLLVTQQTVLLLGQILKTMMYH